MQGSYLDSATKDCMGCNKYCKDCAGPSIHNCTACNTDFTFLPLTAAETDDIGISSGSCKRTCTSKEYYIGLTINECRPCHISCLSCLGPTSDSCLSCSPDFYQVQNSCYRCHLYCKTCSGPSPFDCLSCETGNSLTAYNYC